MKEIEQRAREYAQSFRYLDMEDYDNGLRVGRCEGYVKGATEQREIDVKMACKWLEERCAFGVHPCGGSALVIKFRKAMKRE